MDPGSQDAKELELRKVLDAENPADLMSKVLGVREVGERLEAMLRTGLRTGFRNRIPEPG